MVMQESGRSWASEEGYVVGVMVMIDREAHIEGWQGEAGLPRKAGDTQLRLGWVLAMGLGLGVMSGSGLGVLAALR